MTAGRCVNTSSHHWCTPPQYVEAVRACFGGTIALDPCSNKYSVVGAEVEYQLPIDGLVASWKGYPTIYVNPPYGADRARGTTIRDWLRRCQEAHEHYDARVLALVPVATNTRHWKWHVWGVASRVCFLYDTRLRFLIKGKDEGKGAPMACAMIYWGKSGRRRFHRIFSPHGAVVRASPL
jgi:hypothetical protein